MTPDLANINTLWTSVLVEELVRLGVTQFVISPGSRSAPLTVAVARNKRARSVIHFDERGAAFFALGYARATGKPAALICTSGTAVANYLPAVVEASVDCVPMILLTADRPPELRNKGANQTITQPGIYGSYVRWDHDLECPTTETSLRVLLKTVDEMVAAALSSSSGPVHLNCMFREPLAPTTSSKDLEEYASEIAEWTVDEKPFTSAGQTQPPITENELSGIKHVLESTTRGLFVIGALKRDSERKAISSLANHLGWPMIADIGSGLRGGEIRTRIDFFDLSLASENFASSYRPDTVIQFGSRLTSKRLLSYLESSAPRDYIQVLDHPFLHDPIDRVTQRVQSDLADVCTQIESMVNICPSTDWFNRWAAASAKVDSFLEQNFAASTELTEPLLAHLLTSEAEMNDTFWLASSMPIRDLDMFACPRAHWYTVGANRGASGIDGTIASAAGYSAGIGRRVTVLIGDLAMLHDLNSLALVKNSNVELTIILVNNNGGGIFGHLPISEFGDVFEKYFVTPHGYRFEDAARMFGMRYAHAGSSSQFLEALARSKHQSGSCMIEVTMDRERSQRFHQLLVSGAAEKLE